MVLVPFQEEDEANETCSFSSETARNLHNRIHEEQQRVVAKKNMIETNLSPSSSWGAATSPSTTMSSDRMGVEQAPLTSRKKSIDPGLPARQVSNRSLAIASTASSRSPSPSSQGKNNYDARGGGPSTPRHKNNNVPTTATPEHVLSVFGNGSKSNYNDNYDQVQGGGGPRGGPEGNSDDYYNYSNNNDHHRHDNDHNRHYKRGSSGSNGGGGSYRNNSNSNLNNSRNYHRNNSSTSANAHNNDNVSVGPPRELSVDHPDYYASSLPSMEDETSWYNPNASLGSQHTHHTGGADDLVELLEEEARQKACGRLFCMISYIALAICTVTLLAVSFIGQSKGNNNSSSGKSIGILGSMDKATCRSGSLSPFVQCTMCNPDDVTTTISSDFEANRATVVSTLQQVGVLPANFQNVSMSSCTDLNNVAVLFASDPSFYPLEFLGPDTAIIQRYVLAYFYLTTDGSQWKSRLGWLSSRSECEWQGIQCLPTRRIDEIYLSANLLAGSSIPTELGALTRLKSLVLSDNGGLQGTLPPQLFENLSTLRRLDLSGTSVGGTIPSQVGIHNQNLEELILSNTQVSGALPTTLALLPRIRIIQIANASLNGTVNIITNPSTTNTTTAAAPTTGLSLLKELDLSGNELTGELTLDANRLGSLETLNVRNNLLVGAIPQQQLQQLSFLSVANFGINDLTGTISSEICTNLSPRLDTIIVDCNENDVGNTGACPCCTCTTVTLGQDN